MPVSQKSKITHIPALFPASPVQPTCVRADRRRAPKQWNGRTRKRTHIARSLAAQKCAAAEAAPEVMQKEAAACGSDTLTRSVTKAAQQSRRRAAGNTSAGRRACRRADQLVLFTQNCLGIKTDARVWQLLHALKQRHAYAACLQETWRACFAADTYYCESGYTLVEWGPKLQKGRGSAGVAIALSRAAYEAWQKAGGEHWCDTAGRVLALRCQVKDRHTRQSVYLFIVSAYAPHSGMAATEHAAFYASLDGILAHRKRGDVLMMGIDANASIGKGALAGPAAECGAVGPHGIDHVNAAGRRLRTYMETHEFASLASFYRKHHYGTWLHPCSKKLHQLDHIIVAQSERRRFVDAGSCSGQLIGSDHRAVGWKVRIATALERKPPADARSQLTKLDYSSLREVSARRCFAEDVVQRVQKAAGGPGVYSVLAEAVQAATLELLPKRARVSPGWFAVRAPALQRLMDARNRCFDAHLRTPTTSSAVQLRQARSHLDGAVSDAKSAWIQGMCSQINDGIGGKGSAAAWDCVGQIRRGGLIGLQTARRPASANMRFADGSIACSAEENAAVHAEAGTALYGRTSVFDASVLTSLRQRAVMPGLDHVPTEEEIRRCVGKLHDTAPGASGLPAIVWKALVSTSEGYELIEHMVHRFWATAEVPTDWESGLLALILAG